MSPDFNYSEVPATFLHCLNKQCKHSSKCLRYLVTAYVPDSYPAISTVNPVSYTHLTLPTSDLV